MTIINYHYIQASAKRKAIEDALTGGKPKSFAEEMSTAQR